MHTYACTQTHIHTQAPRNTQHKRKPREPSMNIKIPTYRKYTEITRDLKKWIKSSGKETKNMISLACKKFQ